MDTVIASCESAKDVLEIAAHAMNLTEDDLAVILQKAKKFETQFAYSEWEELLLIAPHESELENFILQHLDPNFLV